MSYLVERIENNADRDCRKSANNLTSMAGQRMQAKVWKEIIGVLADNDTAISKIVSL